MHTGISISPQEVIQNDCLSIPQYLNSDAQINISRCINDFYKKGILPTFNDVYISVKDIMPSRLTFSEFKGAMTFLGYVYKKMPFGHMVIENPEITFERFFYLKKILKIRENMEQEIYYIDQRIIDTTLSFPKPFLRNSGATFRSSNDTSIFLYIISASTGKVNGLFTNLLNSATFTKWITDMILDGLNPNSVVVIDSHFKRAISRKEITMYDTKNDILNWLKGSSVPCSSNMRKAELFELYKKTPKKYSTCDFSAILETRGHRVLYSPTNLTDLCPTNLLWEDISRVLKNEDPNSLVLISDEGVSNLITKITALTMPVTATNFSEFGKIIQYREKEVFELDAEVENSLDNLIQNFRIKAHADET